MYWLTQHCLQLTYYTVKGDIPAERVTCSATLNGAIPAAIYILLTKKSFEFVHFNIQYNYENPKPLNYEMLS